MASENIFNEVLEAADHLSLDDQEELLNIINSRLREHKRKILIQDVQKAHEEFHASRCTPMTPADIIKEIQE